MLGRGTCEWNVPDISVVLLVNSAPGGDLLLSSSLCF